MKYIIRWNKTLPQSLNKHIGSSLCLEWHPNLSNLGDSLDIGYPPLQKPSHLRAQKKKHPNSSWSHGVSGLVSKKKCLNHQDFLEDPMDV